MQTSSTGKLHKRWKGEMKAEDKGDIGLGN